MVWLFIIVFSNLSAPLYNKVSISIVIIIENYFIIKLLNLFISLSTFPFDIRLIIFTLIIFPFWSVYINI